MQIVGFLIYFSSGIDDFYKSLCNTLALMVPPMLSILPSTTGKPDTPHNYCLLRSFLAANELKKFYINILVIRIINSFKSDVLFTGHM